MKNAVSSILYIIEPMSVCNFSKSFALLSLEHNRRKKNHTTLLLYQPFALAILHCELLLETTATLVRDSHGSLVPQSYLN